MKVTEERKQEAIRIMEKVGESQWELLVCIANAFPTTPEEKAANVERRENLRRQREAEDASLRKASKEKFDEWREATIGAVEIPARYEPDIPTIYPCVKYAAKENPCFDSVLDAVSAMYDYGFKRGMGYGKNMAKKKAATHAANMKDGTANPANEIYRKTKSKENR